MKNKAITADEAKQLMTGSMERKGWFFKLRLYYFCGLLNVNIEYAAEHKKNDAAIRVSKNAAAQYYPLMARFYENLGYYVRYDLSYERNLFVICWEPEKIPQDQKDMVWDYHTTIEEPKPVQPAKQTKKKESEILRCALRAKKTAGFGKKS